MLLLPAAVRHRVPDGKNVAGSLSLIPVFYFSSFKRDLFFIYPLAVLLYLRPRFTSVLGNYGHARSQDKHQRRPPCTYVHIWYIYTNIPYFEISRIQR